MYTTTMRWWRRHWGRGMECRAHTKGIRIQLAVSLINMVIILGTITWVTNTHSCRVKFEPFSIWKEQSRRETEKSFPCRCQKLLSDTHLCTSHKYIFIGSVNSFCCYGDSVALKVEAKKYAHRYLIICVNTCYSCCCCLLITCISYSHSVFLFVFNAIILGTRIHLMVTS